MIFRSENKSADSLDKIVRTYHKDLCYVRKKDFDYKIN